MASNPRSGRSTNSGRRRVKSNQGEYSEHGQNAWQVKRNGKMTDTGNRNWFFCNFPGCQFRSLWSDSVKRHEKLIHSPTGRKLFSCSFPGCEFQTRWGDSWKRHEKIHDPAGVAKTFACSFPGCEFQTRWMESLKRHEKTHHPVNNHEKIDDKPAPQQCDFFS